MTTPTLFALDVTAAARAAGVNLGARIAVTAAILAGFRDPSDTAALDAFAGKLARLVLEGGYPRRKLTENTELVNVGGRAFALIGCLDAEQRECFTIAAPVELGLAGTIEVAIDVRERASAPREWLQ